MLHGNFIPVKALSEVKRAIDSGGVRHHALYHALVHKFKLVGSRVSFQYYARYFVTSRVGLCMTRFSLTTRYFS